MAVTEIVRDMAPGAELFVASVGTVVRPAGRDRTGSHSKGVTIISRSLGSAYDGPGDGTGPLDTDRRLRRHAGHHLVQLCAATTAQDAYLRPARPRDRQRRLRELRPPGRAFRHVAADRLHRRPNFYCYFLDGVRWANDWYLPPAQRTDYRVEVWEPRPGFNPGSWTNLPTPPPRRCSR